MGKMFRLDARGHGTIAEWTAGNKAKIKTAEEVFKETQSSGYTMVKLTGPKGEGEVLKAFDPAAAEILAVPRLVAG